MDTITDTRYDEYFGFTEADVKKLLADYGMMKGKIRLCDIGTIIGSHAGQGTVAVFFMGDERPHME